MIQKVEISYKTIVFAVFLLLGLWFLYLIRDILFLLLVAFLISLVLNPSVDKLQRLKIPRSVSAIIVYLVFIIILFFSAGIVLKPFIEQTKNLANNFPTYLKRFQTPEYVVERVGKEIESQIIVFTSQILRIGISILSNILAIIATLVFALYFIVAREKLFDYSSVFLSPYLVRRLKKMFRRIEQKVGGWTRAEIILMVVVGLLNYLGFSVLGIPYAVPLGVLAGLLELIPNIGPLVAAVISSVVGFGISPVIGFAVIVLSFLIQQIENYLLVPKVMEKTTGVNPLITLIAVLIGFKLAGIIGTLLSIPIVIILREICKEFLISKSKEI